MNFGNYTEYIRMNFRIIIHFSMSNTFRKIDCGNQIFFYIRRKHFVNLTDSFFQS